MHEQPDIKEAPAQAEAGQRRDEAPAPGADRTCAELARERDEYLDLARRVQADFDNFRRRNREARQDALADGAAGVLEAILPVLDNLDRAREAAVAMDVSGAMAEGIDLVIRQLREILTGFGVLEIEALGRPFDPALHNAVLQGPADSEHPAGTILEVFQQGYAMKERILRHSVVKVAQ